MAVGFIGEVPLLVYSVGSLIAWLAGSLYLIVIVPLPIPLVLALLAVRWFPPNQSDERWLEEHRNLPRISHASVPVK